MSAISRMLDFFGAAVEKARLLVPNVRHLQDYPLYPIQGWTLDGIAEAIQWADHGQFLQGALLGMALTKDDRVRNGLDQRASGPAGLPLFLDSPESEPPEVQRANDVLAVQLRKHIFSDAAQRMVVKNVTMHGLQAAQVVWSVVGDYWVPQIKPWKVGRTRWDGGARRFMAQTTEGEKPINPDGRNWVIFAISEDQPWLDAAERALGLWFFAKSQAVRNWLGYNAVHGQPQRKVKHPAAQREQEDVRRLLNAVARAVNGSVIPLPQLTPDFGFDVELLEAKSDSFRTFPELIGYCDRAITITLVGQTGTTGGDADPGGSRAKSEVEERTAVRLTLADLAMLSAGLGLVLRQFYQVNALPEPWCPVPVWQSEAGDSHLDAEGRMKNAAALKALLEALVGGQPPPDAQLGDTPQDPRDLLRGRVDWERLARAHGLPLIGDPTPQRRRRLVSSSGTLLDVEGPPP